MSFNNEFVKFILSTHNLLFILMEYLKLLIYFLSCLSKTSKIFWQGLFKVIEVSEKAKQDINFCFCKEVEETIHLCKHS